ncbi:MAG: outer membrane beta-barrel protein [Saprospiraceae bacterium]|nr:outer membrane beta-barrel protein [Saprospiraceae bacterium]
MRTLLFLAFSLLTLTLSAQENANSTENAEKNWLFTTATPLASSAGSGQGTLPFGTGFTQITDEEDVKQNILGLNIGIAYRLIDNLYAGLNLGIGREWADHEEFEYSSTTLLVGPRVRYYVPYEKVLFFGEANASFGKITVEFEDDIFGDEDSDSTLSNFGAALGVALPLSPSVNIEGLISYDAAKAKGEEDDDSSINILSFRIGFALRL